MIQTLNQNTVNNVVTIFKKGGVVIFPTDTVYGFLADAGNKKAVNRIYKIKSRPKGKPLPVFINNLRQAKEISEINKDQEKILKKYWPGKYTFILHRKKGAKLCDGGGNTIALRIPKHKFLNSLLKKIGKPLVQTSVNISGQPALAKISDIIEQFRKVDILVIDAGNLKKFKPSKIIDLTKNKVEIIRK